MQFYFLIFIKKFFLFRQSNFGKGDQVTGWLESIYSVFKMFAEESGSLTNRRASDANYDPVQMDMSEV